MNNYFKYLLIFTFLLLLGNWCFGVVSPGEINLKGKWKFSVGDNPAWAAPNFDDSSWEEIYAPENWESQGYRKYDGFAWYRKTITPDKKYANRIIELELGYIDDVDEVFINGVKIGQSGSFPPNFVPEVKSRRKYLVPNHLLNFGGQNTIAIRVYDAMLEGGIIDGNLKLHFQDNNLNFAINLAGEWFFNKGKEVNLNRRTSIIVPGLWENQGFSNYDGYAVYSISFFAPDNLNSEKLIFMAGRIDDVDRVYINGEFVGSTGKYDERIGEDNHLEFRNYFIPDGLIKPGQNNTIEIRVWDERWDGGILEGPIGIITQEKFREYWRSKRRM